MSKKASDVSAVLCKARELLGPNGEHWRKFNGKMFIDPIPGCYCPWLAICEVIHPDKGIAEDGESSEWAEVLGFADSEELFKWADAPERTFADIERAFTEAIELAEKEK